MKDNSGNIALNIETYIAGNNQPTHPNVIQFNKPWNGFRYYMGYTPYPYANGSEENPCLACSNDLINWKKPEGLINPIATCEELECDELKDSHLLYRDDLDRLEMWYLGRLHSTIVEKGELCCFRKISNDGSHWSNYQIVMKNIDFLSPSIIWNGKEYLLWGIKSNKGLYFKKSVDAVNWTEEIKCDIPNIEETQIWHGTVSYTNNQYCFVWVGNGKKSRNEIYFSTSNDGEEFTDYKIVITNNRWKYLYRPCMIFENNMFYCYYGVIRHDGKWLISLSKGKEVDNLLGITSNELSSESSNAELMYSNNIQKLKYKFRDISKLFSLIMFIFELILVFALLIFNDNILYVWFISLIVGFVLSYIKIQKDFYISIKQSLFMSVICCSLVNFIFDIFQLL